MRLPTAVGCPLSFESDARSAAEGGLDIAAARVAVFLERIRQFLEESCRVVGEPPRVGRRIVKLLLLAGQWNCIGEPGPVFASW